MARTRRSGAFQEETEPSKNLALSSELPLLAKRRSSTRLSKSAAPTPKSVSSAASPKTSYFSDSEKSTPLTSNVPTPAPSFIASASKAPSTSAASLPGNKIEVVIPVSRAPADSARALRQSIYSTRPKRKREIVDSEDDEYGSEHSPDAKLARKLQDEEDAKFEPSNESLLSSRRGPRTSLRGNGKSPSSALSARSAAGPSVVKKAGSRKKKGFVADLADDSEAMDDDRSFHEDIDSDDESVVPSRSRRKVRARASLPSKLTSKRGTRSAKAKAVTSEDDEDDEAEEDVGGVDSDSTLTSLALSYSSPSEAEEDNSRDDRHTAVRRAMANRRGYRAYHNKKAMKKARDRLEELHPELKTMWDELKNMPLLRAGKAEQPKTISRQLKPFQLEGLAWMLQMEKTEWKGGLLGDEMGLGKTIQAVSLIMSDFPAKNPSLVLVPPVALMQWMTEIESYTDGTLKTLVFHGTNTKTKNLTVKDLKKYDVVIMSYNSLESMYRKQEKGFKRKEGIYKEQSVIHQTLFHRVILDEAHSIKTRTTMTAKACFALKTEYRWCLSGTPLQNRIGEFFSLIRFLNVRPFSCYLCRQCSCNSLEWHMDDQGNCEECGHGGMRHVSVFNQELLNPIQKYGNKGEGADAFKKLRILTDRIMLRRLKKDHTNSMELPVKEILVDRQFFGEEENDFSNSIMTNAERQFDTYVASGVMLNNYANIFGLIMQMRQCADHPDLLLKKHSEGGQNVLVCCICDEPAVEAIRSRCKHDFCRSCARAYLNSAKSQDPDCPSCHIPLSIDLEMPEIEQDEAFVKKSSIINRIKMENWTSSSKIELLVHDLHRLRSDNASHKSIIFSQFTTMLQLVEWRLRRAGITTVMLDGSMTPAQRQASIEHFMKNVEVECFLVSLKAGGVALNLTEASRVFIIDPWWNPAAEWQSADRCHRIGQTRPCTITRLCIEDSVESRMVLLQEKKANMINSTINSDDAAMDSLSPEDLQFLFRGT
ncbi:hypothetical protein GQ53DRAFT_809074 [Thozetella sp. PMI_491]|nr:hypothetical protein GQ53DRAFT_809074 [Thozetella sp. PMI_491]